MALNTESSADTKTLFF